MEKDISALVRLKKWQVDEEQRALGDILKQIAEAENQLAMLEQHVRSEQEIAASDPEGIGFAYGRFAMASVEMRGVIQKAIQNLEAKERLQRDKVAAAYRDFKTAEQLQKNRETRAYQELERKNQAAADEMSATSHRRRQKEGGR